jgi:hypothetical protein
MAADKNFLQNINFPGFYPQTPLVPTPGNPRPVQPAPAVDPRVGQMNGPAYGGDPWSVNDWQSLTGPYKAKPSKDDRFTPTGFHVPGVLTEDQFGLRDVVGREVSKEGVQPTVSNTRNVQKVNALGVAQSGTQTSPASTPIDMNRSFNDLFQSVNGRPFSSNQLPTTEGSPDAAVSPKTQAITNIGPVADGQEYANNLGRQGTRGIGPVADGQVYGNTLENAPGAGTKGIGPLADGAAYARAVEGKGKSTSRLDAALADTDGINSYMSKFSSGAQERAANRAFLDGDGSQAGLRAKEAVNGVVYAGGKHYVSGKSGDDAAVAIDRSAARDISNGKETASGASQKAQDLLAKKTADVVAAVKQSPTLLKDGAKNQAFQQDKPMSATMPSDIGGKTEFYSNNDNAPESFGGPKGYKSGFKRIDTSIPNPFGG